MAPNDFKINQNKKVWEKLPESIIFTLQAAIAQMDRATDYETQKWITATPQLSREFLMYQGFFQNETMP